MAIWQFEKSQTVSCIQNFKFVKVEKMKGDERDVLA